MTSRIVKVALAVTVFFLLTGASFAQGPWSGQGNRGWGYQGNAQGPYDRGYRDGRSDREHGRAWSPRNNGKKYIEGYRAGYGSNGGGWRDHRNDHDADDAHRGGTGPYRGGPYGNYPSGTAPYGNTTSNAQRVAYNNGYQEGMRYGAADRNNGHSNRPTYSSTYQRGTSGYNSSMGSETAYKHSFQDGYRAGYDAGYNGRRR